ncbi:histidine phosphatase family protein [Lachnoclostridium phytofermentans]|uniref:Phosphoglycerate mutase n=1 Tax=Lachnoclostridium phytofermentans (strain ATCC 700394 / DSM 18823 / ISDg) TaxID=357809 RepID=A9KT58_LACP7|nr:histidine phosphatase family protein [Lachnoclostridium phytofermentans]ABX42269.1 Phosphoglycerate mutase [Lachnoclostridium phytofermentans ISDg]
MNIYFIRHGETDWNVENKIQGSNDIDLNENGINQALALGEKVKTQGLPIHKVYSSPQKRARKTAKILSEALQVDHIVKAGLEEMNLGRWEGFTWKEVKETDSETFNIWHANRNTKETPDGESYEEVLSRSIAAIQSILKNESQDIAIVSHGAVIKCLLCYINKVPFDQMKQFQTGNTSITIMDAAHFR